MSFEKIDQYIRELEAIKNYDRVKAERDSLLTKVKKLEANLSSEKGRVEELLQTNKNLKEQVKAKNDEIESLKSELKAKEGRIGELEGEVQRLSSRVKELEELKALAEGKTLKEAEEAFLKARDEEIKRRTRELFDRWKSEWEKKDKPREVSNEAIGWLKHILEQRGKPGFYPIRAEIVEAGLPEKVEEVLNLEVKRRIDVEFLRRVREESIRRAFEELERLKSVEWPNWYRSNVEPRILQLEFQMRSNAIRAFEGPWIVRCDKCGTSFQVELTAKGIEDLLRSGKVMIECLNPSCMDSSISGLRRHKIRITLRELIESKCVG